MKLPSLKVSLPIIFLCWCVAGVMTHGTVILAYPAMWAAVGLFFYGLHVVLKAPASQAASGAASPDSQRDAVSDDTPTDHQVSASA